MRRYGSPMIMGGMGMGSPLMTGLMAGGLGYLFGSNANQQATPMVQQVPVPVYQPPQMPQATPVTPSSADSGIRAQLKLLGELHDSGVVTDDEFAREKNRLLDR